MGTTLSQNDSFSAVIWYNMGMTRKLSDEEKKNNRLRREEKLRVKDLTFQLDERGYEMLRILRDAPSHPEVKYNSKYFAGYFKVSEPTIFRLVQNLRENDILEEKQVHGSYVIKSGFEDSYYSEETKRNLALVASLKGLLQQYKGTPLFESVTKLIYFLQPEVAKNDDMLSSGRVVVSPQMEYDIDVKNWDRVYAALQKNHKIQFRYLKSYTNNEAERIVWPFQLVLDNGSVYLFAYSEYADAVLLYDLNYMADVAVLDEEFELPEKYDINDYSGGGRLGAFVGDNIERFEIRFSGYAKEWMKKHKLAADQVYKEEEDSAVVSFSSSQYERVLELILSWGCQAEPVSPASLVERWKDAVMAMAEKAGKR